MQPFVTLNRKLGYYPRTLGCGVMPADCGYWTLVTKHTAAQPLLEHHQAKQKLVVVLAAGLMTFEESSHRLRIE